MSTGDGSRPVAAHEAPWQADFDAFVRVHWAQLHAAVTYAARRYRQEPDDALQEALLRAYANRDTFESEQHAVNWICRVARDLLCDQRRSWYGRRVTSSDDLPEDAFETAPDPADVVAGRDAGRHVLRAVAALPLDHRLLLWQHAVDGRSYADIARETARPLATVRSIALRARAHARRHLGSGEGVIGEGAIGVWAWLRVRLVTWRVHAVAMPVESIAALVVLTLPLAFGAAGGGATTRPHDARPPSGGVVAARQVSPPVVHRRPSAPVVARSGTPAPVAGGAAGPAALPVGKGTTYGERWGTCEFGGEPTTRDILPLIGLVDAGRYACHVEAKSTACTLDVPGMTCAWTLRGDIAGKAKGVAAPVRLCDPKSAQGTFALTIGGVRYDVPIRLFLNDDGILGNADVELGDRVVSVGLQIPYVCSEQNPRAPVVVGQITVTAR